MSWTAIFWSSLSSRGIAADQPPILGRAPLPQFLPFTPAARSRPRGTGRPVARLAEPEQEHGAPPAGYGPGLGTFGSGPRSPRSPRVVSRSEERRVGNERRA